MSFFGIGVVLYLMNVQNHANMSGSLINFPCKRGCRGPLGPISLLPTSLPDDYLDLSRKKKKTVLHIAGNLFPDKINST